MGIFKVLDYIPTVIRSNCHNRTKLSITDHLTFNPENQLRPGNGDSLLGLGQNHLGQNIPRTLQTPLVFK